MTRDERRSETSQAGRDDAPRRRRLKRHAAASVILAVLLTGSLIDVAAATPPTADFAPPAARTGLPATFSATAAGTNGATISSYAWTFGDSGTGTGASPQHTYATAATASVTLTVTDNNNEQTVVTHPVTVTGPTPAFTSTPAITNIGQAMAFDGSTATGATGYDWTFGDGGTGTGVNPQHTYAASGDMQVTLKVTAADGASQSTTRAVHVNVPPKAAYAYAALVDAAGGQLPSIPVSGQQVAFNGSGSSDADGSIASYAWDLGDGTFGAPAPGANLMTTFAAAGSRTVRLQVTDNNGATDIASVTFRVDSMPVAALSHTPEAPRPNQVIDLTSTATDPDGPQDITAYAWELNNDGKFDDGTGPTSQVIFTHAGDFNVGLRVTDAAGVAATAFRTITVAGLPAAPPPPGDRPAGSAGPTVVSTPAGGDRTPPVPGAATGDGRAVRPPAGVRVRIAGHLALGATTISQLLIIAPRGALVTATCHGGGCRKRAIRSTIGRTGRLRLRLMQRTLQPGARIDITVTKQGYMTKRVVFTVRRGLPPTRRETCSVPGTKKSGPCPA